MNKHRIATLAAVLSLLFGVAQAHTHLEKATPADNSVVASPPSQLMLHFSEASRLTALSIEKDGSSEATTISELPKNTSQALTVPLSPLAPGKYLVKWRAIGADKHVMSGTLHFTVTGK